LCILVLQFGSRVSECKQNLLVVILSIHLCAQLGAMVEETANKRSVLCKPYFGPQTLAHLRNSSKWSLGDVAQFGQIMIQFVEDISELEQRRDIQRDALKALESDMLRGVLAFSSFTFLEAYARTSTAVTRKEEIVRFNKAKTDTEFAKMLKVRTLGPEHLETQSQLRRDISVCFQFYSSS
jgi:nucleoporin NUP159